MRIDHMSVRKNGILVKDFQAWDRCSKYIYAGYFQAKSPNTKELFKYFLKKVSFGVRSICSEFRADFQDAWAQWRRAFMVFPPSRAPYNDGVQRRIFRQQLYPPQDLLSDSLGAMQFVLYNGIHIQQL